MDSMLFITCQIEPNNNPQLQLKTRLSHVMSCFQTIMKALVKNKAVQELRLENQYNPLGTRTEMDVARFLEKNTILLKLGLTVKGGGARQRIETYLLRNNDTARQRRRLNSQS
jgi:hypothetical protein